MDKYRTFSARVIALLIDGLVCLPLLLFVNLLEKDEISVALQYFCLLLMILTPTVYRITMHTLYGRTLGKMGVGVKVLTEGEQPITFNHAVLRASPQIFFSISLILFSKPTDDYKSLYELVRNILLVFYLLWIFLDNIVALSSDKRQSLHDWIAGTVVVKI